MCWQNVNVFKLKHVVHIDTDGLENPIDIGNVLSL